MDRSKIYQSKGLVMTRGIMISYLVTAGMLLLLAFLLYQLDLKEKHLHIGVILTYIVSCFSGGIWIGKKVEKQKYIWGFLLGILYFVILVTVSALSERGIQAEWKSVLLTWVMCAGSGMLGGMLS